ncbi:MAG: hypothetical protein ACJ789_02890 [Thermomicrobiales bacterium]
MNESSFDQERADELVGKTTLVGLTYLNADGTVNEKVQLFGTIVSFDETIVTLRRADNGEDFTLPPALWAFEEAEPGEYRLHSTGEVVVDPDLISTWTIRAPGNGSDDDDEEDESEG